MYEDNANIDISTTSQTQERIQEPEPCRGRRRLSVVTIELPEVAPPKYTTATLLSKPPVYTETEGASLQRPPGMFEGEPSQVAPSGGFYEQYVDHTVLDTTPRERLPWYRYKITMWVCFFAVIIIISVIVHFLRPGYV